MTGQMVGAIRVRVAPISGDHSVDQNFRALVETLHQRLEHVVADIVEHAIDVIRQNLAEPLAKAIGLVVHCVVETERVLQEDDLVRTAGNADDPAPAQIRSLCCDRAD